jgi:hypothetical protein
MAIGPGVRAAAAIPIVRAGDGEVMDFNDFDERLKLEGVLLRVDGLVSPDEEGAHRR